MDISKISIGRNPPDDFNTLIEIPQGGYSCQKEFLTISKWFNYAY
jgi:hypothetical protein